MKSWMTTYLSQFCIISSLIFNSIICLNKSGLKFKAIRILAAFTIKSKTEQNKKKKIQVISFKASI